jgi:RsiW-degrading membrane proteinase PrsW (M82 family)
MVELQVIGLNEINGILEPVTRPTIFAIFIHAFLQVALLEETTKLIAFKTGDYIRGKIRDLKDKPFAVMFYAGMISVGFALIENISYAGRALWGDLSYTGVSPEDVLIRRSMSAVILHMLAGMFMGYFIALGRMFSSNIKKAFYTFLGLISATFIHGAYDFLLMIPNNSSDFLILSETFIFHIPTTIIILIGTMTAYIMGSHLLRLKYRNKKLR